MKHFQCGMNNGISWHVIIKLEKDGLIETWYKNTCLNYIIRFFRN